MCLFEIADEYCKKSDWKTFALLKLCLLALGIIVGMQVPKNKKKAVLGVGIAAFAVSYIPLMAKFVCIWKETVQARNEQS